jgi:Type IV secretory pathway, VirB2 components (pilins)
MSLLMFEMKKLFLKRSILIVTFLFILIPLIPYAVGEIYSNNNMSSQTYYEFVKPYEGAIDQKVASEAREAVVKLLEQKLKNRDGVSAGDTPEQTLFYIDYYNASLALDKYRNGDGNENPEKPYSLNGIRNRMDKLESEGKQNTYEYRMRKMQYNALESSGAPEFRYVRPWRDLFSFTTMGAGYLFVAFLLLFVISPLFSNERTTGMDSIILSSRYGRVRAVTAKLIAAIIFTSFAVLVNNLLQFAVHIGILGTMGWDAPLKSIYGYVFCPYDITILHFFMIQVGLQIFGSIVIAITIAFVSSLCRSSLSTFLYQWLPYSTLSFLETCS